MTLSDKERASSPEASPDELMSLAKKYPREILQNPLLPLLLLEDYHRWRTLLFFAGNCLLSQELQAASPAQKRLLAQQFKQMQPAIAPILDEVRRYNFEPLQHRVALAIQSYQSLESSFVALCAFNFFALSSSALGTSMRLLDTHLFETRSNRTIELPYYVVELWEREHEKTPDPLVDIWDDFESMHTRGTLFVEVEQLMELVSDCLLEEMPWEELHQKYKHPTLSE